MVNKCILVGNVGADPEVKYTASGQAVANFSMATSENWKDKNTGERVEKTEWHRIVAWGRLGEIIGEYVVKGMPLYIEGKIQTRSWEDQDGNKRFTTEIVAFQMKMLGKPGGGDQRSNHSDRYEPQMQSEQDAAGSGPEVNGRRSYSGADARPPEGVNLAGEKQKPMFEPDDDIPF